jgi:hypothetical protein
MFCLYSLFTGHISAFGLSREYPDDISCEYPDIDHAREFPDGKTGQQGENMAVL